MNGTFGRKSRALQVKTIKLSVLLLFNDQSPRNSNYTFIFAAKVICNLSRNVFFVVFLGSDSSIIVQRWSASLIAELKRYFFLSDIKIMAEVNFNELSCCFHAIRYTYKTYCCRKYHQSTFSRTDIHTKSICWFQFGLWNKFADVMIATRDHVVQLRIQTTPMSPT